MENGAVLVVRGVFEHVTAPDHEVRLGLAKFITCEQPHVKLQDNMYKLGLKH